MAVQGPIPLRVVSLENTSASGKFSRVLRSNEPSRIALAKIHPFNSMNSLIIDEGFGVFDSDNLKRLPEMLEPLTLIFNQIFIITHIDELQSELKQKIHVTKDTQGIPKIQY